jgi:hypothetical protein
MGRIRTIKPEFPQSESMGRISRDARLLFIQLWTLCDDAGRARASSRMLASLLFPYDEDAGKRLDGWMRELEREGCVIRYQAEGMSYLQVCNWLNHQKIDRPSQSKIPPFDESSRALANPREPSSGDQGSKDLRIKDQGSKDQGPVERSRASTRKPPDDFELTKELREWAWKNCPAVDVEAETEAFKDYTFASGKTDWIATWRNWMRKAVKSGKSRPTRYEENMARLNAWEPKESTNVLLIGGKL